MLNSYKTGEHLVSHSSKFSPFKFKQKREVAETMADSNKQNFNTSCILLLPVVLLYSVITNVIQKKK